MPPPTEAEMMADLEAADAAGDYELANAIAGRIKSVREAAPKPLGAGQKLVNMVGRGAWALPGLVGLSHEKAQALLAGKDEEQQKAVSRRVDAENPITSGVVRGLAATPGEALAWMAAPEVKAAPLVRAGVETATKLGKALTYGPRMGTLTAASEYGSTAHKPAGERAIGAGIAGAAGTVLGGLMASHLPNPAVLAPSHPAYDHAAPEMALARAEGNATSASRAMSAAESAAEGGNAAAQSASTVVVKPSRPTMLSRALREPEPTPEAQYLAGRGVRLTKGLNDPNTAYGATEIASQSKGVTGPFIRKQRMQALDDATHVAFEEARPPGSTSAIGREGDINAKYARLKGMWDEAYDAIRGKDELIQPSIIEGEMGTPLKGTPEMPGVIDKLIDDTLDPIAAVWDDASRGQARKFLDNQFSRLNAGKHDPAMRVPLGDMLTMLKDVRKASRAALEGEKHDLHQILARAEDAIEQAVESQASPQTSAQLRALNGKYRDFKTIEDAVVRAKDAPSGITPAQLSMSVKATEPMRSRYAAGGGGELRTLSKAVRKVFDESGMPPTGARLATVAPTWLHDMTIGPTMYLRNASSVSATGGKAGARSLAAARAAARAREAVQASTPGQPDSLAAFLSGYPRDASQSPAAMTTADPIVRALMEALSGWRARLVPAVADEESP